MMLRSILIALTLSGCIMPDESETDLPVCDNGYGWSYCEAPVYDLRHQDGETLIVPCYGAPAVYIVDDGYIWSKTCNYVCYEEVCLDD